MEQAFFFSRQDNSGGCQRYCCCLSFYEAAGWGALGAGLYPQYFCARLVNEGIHSNL
jgi:hypothetical protein